MSGAGINKRRIAVAVARKDLTIEWNSSILVNQVAPFAAIVMVLFAFALDNDGILLRVAGVDMGAIFVGKAIALMVQLFVLELMLVATAVVLYGVEMTLAGFCEAIVTLVVATIGLGSVGTLYGGLAAGARGRETLLPLLLLPAVAPVLIGATRATEAAFGSGGTTVSEGWPWIGLLLVFAVLFSAVGTVAFGPLVDE